MNNRHDDTERIIFWATIMLFMSILFYVIINHSGNHRSYSDTEERTYEQDYGRLVP